jgi:hypothetical protein
MKEVDPANLQGIREEIDLYDRIRDKISGLTSILKVMNTLTPDMHRDSDFDEIYASIERRMADASDRLKPETGESPSQTKIYIRLNQQLCIEDSDSELVSYEIARILNSGGMPELIFYSPGYSDEKLELSQSTDIPSHRRLELLRAVEDRRIFGQDRDDILVESMRVFVDYVYPQLNLLATPTLVGQSIAKVIERLSLHYHPSTDSTKFDVVHKDHRWSFGIYLSPDETEALERMERVGIMSMTLDWGLHIALLDPTVVREEVVPGIIGEFLWQKYHDKTSPDPVEFFKFKDWQVGIGGITKIV